MLRYPIFQGYIIPFTDSYSLTPRHPHTEHLLHARLHRRHHDHNHRLLQPTFPPTFPCSHTLSPSPLALPPFPTFTHNPTIINLNSTNSPPTSTLLPPPSPHLFQIFLLLLFAAIPPLLSLLLLLALTKPTRADKRRRFCLRKKRTRLYRQLKKLVMSAVLQRQAHEVGSPKSHKTAPSVFSVSFASFCGGRQSSDVRGADFQTYLELTLRANKDAAATTEAQRAQKRQQNRHRKSQRRGAETPLTSETKAIKRGQKQKQKRFRRSQRKAADANRTQPSVKQRAPSKRQRNIARQQARAEQRQRRRAWPRRHFTKTNTSSTRSRKMKGQHWRQRHGRYSTTTKTSKISSEEAGKLADENRANFFRSVVGWFFPVPARAKPVVLKRHPHRGLKPCPIPARIGATRGTEKRNRITGREDMDAPQPTRIAASRNQHTLKELLPKIDKRITVCLENARKSSKYPHRSRLWALLRQVKDLRLRVDLMDLRAYLSRDPLHGNLADSVHRLCVSLAYVGTVVEYDWSNACYHWDGVSSHTPFFLFWCGLWTTYFSSECGWLSGGILTSSAASMPLAGRRMSIWLRLIATRLSARPFPLSSADLGVFSLLALLLNFPWLCLCLNILTVLTDSTVGGWFSSASSANQRHFVKSEKPGLDTNLAEPDVPPLVPHNPESDRSRQQTPPVVTSANLPPINSVQDAIPSTAPFGSPPPSPPPATHCSVWLDWLPAWAVPPGSSVDQDSPVLLQDSDDEDSDDEELSTNGVITLNHLTAGSHPLQRSRTHQPTFTL